MGQKAAMACTVAVETVIIDHYNEQLREIMASDEKDEVQMLSMPWNAIINVSPFQQELLQAIKKFRDEEQEHHDIGLDCGAEQAPFYQALTTVIKGGCKVAIAISKNI